MLHFIIQDLYLEQTGEEGVPFIDLIGPWFLSVLIVFFLMLLVVSYIKNRNLKRTIRKLKSDYRELNRRYEDIFWQTNKDSNITQEKANKKNKEYEVSRPKINKDDEKSLIIELSPENTDKNVNQTTNEIKEYDESIFYLGFPDKEKTFYAPEATHFPSDDSFYKIQNMELRLYEKIKQAEMKTALNFPEHHIKRVCETTNAKEPSHSSIQMISPGKVDLVDKDFIVLEKMKVKYV